METKEPDSRLSVRKEDLDDQELYRLNQVISDLYSKINSARDGAEDGSSRNFTRSGVKPSDGVTSSLPPPAPPGSTGAGEYFIRFVDESNSVAAGTDIGTTWGRIDCATGESVKVQEIGIVSRIPPSGASFIVDILYSIDSGATWTSLFPLGTANKLVLPSGSRVATNTNFAVSVLPRNALLRTDYLQVGSSISGGGIVITLNGEII